MPGINRRHFQLLILMALAIFIASCKRSDPNLAQGYIEGEFVYIASPFAGSLKTLSVQKGAEVKQDEVLFELDNISEKAAADEAERRLAQARANLEDARKSRRPSEIKAIESQLEEAREAFDLSQKDLERQKKLFASGASTATDLDHARSTCDQDSKRVSALEADLETAKLGSRSDQISAAENEVRAREAMLEGAKWNLSQKTQVAPQSAFVFDTLYRQGEWVAAGRPVVVLLPPRNIKVRAFVAEKKISHVHVGDHLKVVVDGSPSALDATVSYVSPQAEYTPPVIYSKENRSKLMFMVEGIFSPADAANLHPGQPVDVQFNP